jgi:hypothetical protein
MQTEWGQICEGGSETLTELILGLLLFAIMYWGIVGFLMFISGG